MFESFKGQLAEDFLRIRIFLSCFLSSKTGTKKGKTGSLSLKRRKMSEKGAKPAPNSPKPALISRF